MTISVGSGTSGAGGAASVLAGRSTAKTGGAVVLRRGEPPSAEVIPPQLSLAVLWDVALVEEIHQGESGGGAELIQEQLRWYKSQVKCNVVPAQDKEVVLSKCGHMYSRQAVDQLLQGRNRKCPSCGTRFDRADVLPIFFV